MDAARAAGMSDPAMNFQFSRRWTPPPERKRPLSGGTESRAVNDLGSSSKTSDIGTAPPDQAKSARGGPL